MSEDLLAGKKEILDYLRRADWSVVEALIRDRGLPVRKIGGRWEALKSKLDDWYGKAFQIAQID